MVVSSDAVAALPDGVAGGPEQLWLRKCHLLGLSLISFRVCGFLIALWVASDSSIRRLNPLFFFFFLC